MNQDSDYLEKLSQPLWMMDINYLGIGTRMKRNRDIREEIDSDFLEKLSQGPFVNDGHKCT